MKKLRQILLFALVLAMMVQLQSVTYATNESPAYEDADQYLVSVERILPEEAKEKLPEEVYNVFYGDTSDDEVTPYGIFAPEKSNVYDLNDGSYHFWVNSSSDIIYSRYVFTGHDGAMLFVSDETSTSEPLGTYTLHIFKYKLILGTEIHTYAIPRGTNKALAFQCNADDLIYFGVNPKNKQTTLSNSSYVWKAIKHRPNSQGS